jgi:hypothetical protein
VQEIYHQGQFDGACFLYSIVNGYSALLNHPIEQDMWEKALKWIPFRSDYISETGTQRTDDDFNLYKFTIYRMLREFKGGKKVSTKEYEGIDGIKKMKSLITKDSVLILNKKGEHWVVAVDYDDRGFQIVCSSQLTEKKSQYQEYESANFKRKYNYVQRFGKLGWLYHPSLIALSVNSA